MTVAACTPRPLFAITTAAGHYSAMAGTLAGFAFTAALLTLNPRQVPTTPPMRGHALVSFICAFVGLLISAWEFGVVTGYTGPAGEGGQGGLAVSQEMMTSASFGLSILLLLYGLLNLIGDEQDYQRSRRAALMTAVVAGPLMVLAYFFGGVADIRNYRLSLNEPGTCQPSFLDWWTRGAFIAYVVVVAVALAKRRRAKRRRIIVRSRWSERRDILPLSVLLLAVITTFAQVIIAAVVPHDRVAPDVVFVCFIGYVAATCAVVSFLGLTADVPASSVSEASAAPPPQPTPADRR